MEEGPAPTPVTSGEAGDSGSPSEADTPLPGPIPLVLSAKSDEALAARRGWQLELRCLPALLHNRHAQIAPRTQRLARAARRSGRSPVTPVCVLFIVAASR